MKTATGKVIKAFRKHLNYKQVFVASEINITVETLANIENGRVGVDMGKLYHFGLLFKVPPKVILELIIEIHETGNHDWLDTAIKKILPHQSTSSPAS